MAHLHPISGLLLQELLNDFVQLFCINPLHEYSPGMFLGCLFVIFIPRASKLSPNWLIYLKKGFRDNKARRQYSQEPTRRSFYHKAFNWPVQEPGIKGCLNKIFTHFRLVHRSKPLLNFRDSQIGNLDILVFGEQHIQGFDVPVNDIVLVQVIERLCDLVRDIPDHGLLELLLLVTVFLQLGLQVAAFNVLHHNEEGVVLLKSNTSRKEV